MTFFMMAVACAVIGVFPLIFKRKTNVAMIVSIVATLVLFGLFWLGSAHIVGPFFGSCGWAIFVLWIVSAVIDCASEDRATWSIVFPAILAIVVLVATPLGSRMFRSGEFAKLIGPFEERVWTQDIQPKSPQHIRLVNHENAFYRAKNSLKGEIGSQFEIAESNMTLQKIRGKLYFVVPLDFRSYGAWSNTDGAPGYIKISAEDDEQEPELVLMPAGKKFAYTPGAYFNHELQRHLRVNGNINVGLCDYSLEIDDQDNPWWVVTTYQPTIMNTGEKVKGTLIVNPVTGETKTYSLESTPVWVDRVVPHKFVVSYLTNWGEYKHGFINTLPIVGNSQPRVKPVDPNLYYGSDGEPYWVTDITSINSKETSLIGLFYINSRTGKSVFYRTDGGSTTDAIQSAINADPQVKYLHLRAGDAQLYNLYGTMASVTSLLNENHARQGVAIVNVKNIQKVAVGNDVYEAIGKYQDIIGNHTKGVVEKNRDTASVTGVVKRIHQEFVVNGNSNYLLYLEGTSKVFHGTKRLSAKLPITEKGDKVKIEYNATPEASIPMVSFDNVSIVLEQSPAEKQATEEAQKNQDAQKTQNNALTTKERINNLSPEKLKELEKLIPAPK
jgi:hypothetical protein